MKILIGILLITSLGSAWAHSFSLVFVMPMSGPQKELGRQALNGFLLATTEEDAHADETSDGHLGGLDSHVLKVDSRADSTVMLKTLDDMMQTRQPIFVTGLFTAETTELIAKSLKSKNTVFFDPVETAMWEIALIAPDSLKSMNGGSLSARFRKRYGYLPTPEAIRGYIAARLIAATVRSLPEEDLNNNETLLRAFNQIQSVLQ